MLERDQIVCCQFWFPCSFFKWSLKWKLKIIESDQQLQLPKCHWRVLKLEQELCNFMWKDFFFFFVRHLFVSSILDTTISFNWKYFYDDKSTFVNITARRFYRLLPLFMHRQFGVSLLHFLLALLPCNGM
jgi:hypothetical protein